MTELAVGGRSAAEYFRGALYGLAAVSIWSGWIAAISVGVYVVSGGPLPRRSV